VTACDAGFLDEAVSYENLMIRAKEKAADLSKLPAHSFKKAKLRLRKEILSDLHEAIENI